MYCLILQRKVGAFILLVLYYCSCLIGQDTIHKINFGVNSGIINYTCSDKMLNDYNYSGNYFLPAQYKFSYLGANNIHNVYFYYKPSVLEPNDNNALYKYNQLHLWDNALNYEYFHKLNKQSIHNINFYVGTSIGLYAIVEQENYSSSLNTSATGTRFSYDCSGMNLFISAMIQYQFKKNSIYIKFGNSLISYNSRPDDYYIKFGGNTLNWKLYSVKEFESFTYSMEYCFYFSRHFSMNINYCSQYNSYNSISGIRFYKQLFLYGISYKL
jgi:hypothetical protein